MIIVNNKLKVKRGSSLEDVVSVLLDAKARGESVYCEFEGHKLHSDNITMDSAFLEVTGLDKEDYDREQSKIKRAKENIPVWIKEGEALIFPERHKKWKECVKARAADIYHGQDLDMALDIMKALDDGASIEEAQDIFNHQIHSSVTDSFVRNMIFSFSSRGPEFWEATAYGEISPENRELLEAKKQENEELMNSKKSRKGRR